MRLTCMSSSRFVTLLKSNVFLYSRFTFGRVCSDIDLKRSLSSDSPINTMEAWPFRASGPLVAPDSIQNNISALLPHFTQRDPHDDDTTVGPLWGIPTDAFCPSLGLTPRCGV